MADQANEGPGARAGAPAWPGLESLPPEPPTTWGPPKERPPPKPRLEQTPPPPPPPSPTRRWPWGFVVLAITGSLTLVVASTALILTRAGGDESGQGHGRRRTTTSRSAPTQTSRTTLPTTTAPPPPTTVPADPPLTAAAGEISAFVANLRGRPLLAPIGVLRLEDAEFDARVRAGLDPGGLGDQLALLGLTAPNDDFDRRYVDERVKFTLAMYENDTKLVVLRGKRGTPLTAEEKVVLAHELTHAYDDQHFHISRKELRANDSEIVFGRAAAVEGNAMRVEEAWARTQGLRIERSPKASYDDVIDAQLNGRYDFGLPLVEAALQQGGEAAVDRLLADPLTTSEQVMHRKFDPREPELPVEKPRVDGWAEESAPVGELLLRQLLTAAVGPEQAERAAAGWGGDRSLQWITTKPEHLLCQRTRYVMDTPADLAELEAAVTTWAAGGKHRTAARVQIDRLDVTSCTPVS